jgi:hypothetical protein
MISLSCHLSRKAAFLRNATFREGQISISTFLERHLSTACLERLRKPHLSRKARTGCRKGWTTFRRGQQSLGNPVLHGAGVAHHALLISERLAASLGGRDFSVLPWKVTCKDHVYNSRGLTGCPVTSYAALRRLGNRAAQVSHLDG